MKGNSETNQRPWCGRTNERTDRMSSDGGRSLHRHGGVGRAGGVGPSHYPPPLALPSALSASAFLPSNGSRSIRDETHTFFPRFSEWTRGQRLRTRGPRGPGWETEGGRDLPPARPKANIYPWTTATDTDLDLLHDRGLARRRRGDACGRGGREGGRPWWSGT